MINGLEVILEMMKNGDDVSVAPLANIVNVQIKKKQGQVTIVIDGIRAMDILGKKRRFAGGLLLADYDQYQKRIGKSEIKNFKRVGAD